MTLKYLCRPHGQEMDTGFSMIEDLKRENVRIVYQGVEGSYGHGAARRYFGPEVPLNKWVFRIR